MPNQTLGPLTFHAVKREVGRGLPPGGRGKRGKRGRGVMDASRDEIIATYATSPFICNHSFHHLEFFSNEIL